MAAQTRSKRAQSKLSGKEIGETRKMIEEMVDIKELKDLVDWFEANHETKDKVALKIYKKHTGYNVPSHNEQVRTAICYGWIDTTVKRIDDDSYMRIFVRRKDSANWSENTLKYAAELKAQGKMKPLGMHRYQQGLEKRTRIKVKSHQLKQTQK